MKKWSWKKEIRLWARWLALAVLVCAVSVQLAACGSAGTPEGPAEGHWGYLPEFITVDGENADYSHMQLMEDCLFYLSQESGGEGEDSRQKLYRYSLTEGELSSISLDWGTEEADWYIREFAAAKDGGVYVVACEDNIAEGIEGSFGDEWYLCRFNQNGNQIFSKNITSRLESGYSCRLLTDEQGYLYLGCGASVWRFDGDGNEQGSIALEDTDSWVAGLGRNREGRVFAAFRADLSITGGTGGVIVFSAVNMMDAASYTLAELDFEEQQAQIVSDSFSAFQVSPLLPGTQADFLMYNSGTVYEYDFETQSEQTLFNWLDCDLNGSYAKILGVLEDGRVVAVFDQGIWGNDRGIALLTKTWMEPETEKETLVLATMSSDNSMQAAVVAFNRASDRYRIVIEQYYDSADGKTRADALVNLNNAIVSDNCPDIIDLTGLDVEALAAKGVFEDLGPYLEAGGGLDREDVLESILNAYTFGGTLTAIPRRFSVQTTVGSAAGLAGLQGWTIEDVIAYADAHPQAELFHRSNKSSVLEYLLRCNQELFIDWTTGECSFDSDQFKSLLEFTNRFADAEKPDAGILSGGLLIIQNEEETSEPERIQRGEVLLSTEFMTDLNSAQMYKEMFQGDVQYIGYPTPDGSSGHVIVAATQAYGISSRSDSQAGAWEFIESVLMQEENASFQLGFPSLKDRLAAEVKRELNSGYLLDEDGEPILDEDGEPIVNSDFSSSVYMSSVYMNGWTYTYRSSTQEEIDQVLAVLEEVRLVWDGSDEIMNIISEEAEAFYQGQKTVDQVADVIQSRVSLYVSEHM